MIPGAGLYLPETLYANQKGVPSRTEARSSRHKYFERTSTLQSMDKHLNSSRTSLALSRKSSEDVTRVFSSLSTVFDFADYALSSDKVSSDSEVFIHLLQRVRQDVTEASRLYTSQPVTDYFESWPDKKTWVDSILVDIQRALNDIGVYMETVRISGDDGGTTGLRRRFEWVLSHQKKLLSKQQNLMVCHQSLGNALHIMLTVEMNVAFNGQDPIYEAPTQPWLQEESNGVLRSPHSRQKWRLGQKNLSLPSITVSESGADKNDLKLVESAPVELPGSTPDDLPHPDNLDLYAPPTKPRSASVNELPLESMTTQSSPMQVMATENQMPHPPSSRRPNAEAPTEPPAKSLPPRRSLDQVRPRFNSIDQTSAPSLAHGRPRAYSDQVDAPASFAVRPRASFDQVRPLPTLKEKPLERFDSNATVLSVTEAAKIPLQTMRYRPKAVNVRKPPPKHRSLPSRLPSLSSQTSLMDELSNWVLPTSARSSYIGSESPVSVNASTPSTSITSSPVSSISTTICPGIIKGFGPSESSPSSVLANSPTDSSPWTHIPPTTVAVYPGPPSRAPPLAPQPSSSNPALANSRPTDDITRLVEHNTPVPNIPEKIIEELQSDYLGGAHGEKNSDIPTQAQSTGGREVLPELPPRPAVTTAKVEEVTCRSPPQSAVNDAIPPPAMKIVKEIISQASSPEVAGSTVPEEVEYITSQKLVVDTKLSDPRRTPSSESTPGKSIEPESTKPGLHNMPSELPTTPSSPATSSPKPASPPTAPTSRSRPMTAQAKRRAAHERRMQLAYGKDSNKAVGRSELETEAAQ